MLNSEVDELDEDGKNEGNPGLTITGVIIRTKKKFVVTVDREQGDQYGPFRVLHTFSRLKALKNIA